MFSRKRIAHFNFLGGKVPEIVLSAEFYCLRDGGYHNIFINDDVCPCCMQSDNYAFFEYYDKDRENIIATPQKSKLSAKEREIVEKYKISNDFSLDVGICLFGFLEDAAKENELIHKNEKGFLFLNSDEKQYKMIVKYTKILIDEIYKKWYKGSVVDEFYNKINLETAENALKHYVEEYNWIYGTPKYISKISVRELFGYHSYDLNFDSPDLSIIIGTNGLGKTTIFKILQIILGGHTVEDFNYLLKIPFKEFCVDFKDGMQVKLIKDTKNLTISYKNRRGGFVWLPDTIINIDEKKSDLKTRRKFNKERKHHYINIARIFPQAQNTKGRRFLFVRTNRENIKINMSKYFDGLRAVDNITLSENISLLNKYFSKLYYVADPSRKTIELNEEKELIVKTSDGKKLDLSCLSSGEINILAILKEMIFESERDSIILVDEPEISLHIAWQQQLGEIIQGIMKEKEGAQVVLATHSPFLAAGNEGLLVEAKLIEE